MGTRDRSHASPTDSEKPWPATEPEEGVGLGRKFEKFKALLQGLTGLLVDKGTVASGELRAAVEAEARGD